MQRVRAGENDRLQPLRARPLRPRRVRALHAGRARGLRVPGGQGARGTRRLTEGRRRQVTLPTDRRGQKGATKRRKLERGGGGGAGRTPPKGRFGGREKTPARVPGGA